MDRMGELLKMDLNPKKYNAKLRQTGRDHVTPQVWTPQSIITPHNTLLCSVIVQNSVLCQKTHRSGSRKNKVSATQKATYILPEDSHVKYVAGWLPVSCPHFLKTLTPIYEPIKNAILIVNYFNVVDNVENNHRHSLTWIRDCVSVQEDQVPLCCLYIL